VGANWIAAACSAPRGHHGGCGPVRVARERGASKQPGRNAGAGRGRRGAGPKARTVALLFRRLTCSPPAGPRGGLGNADWGWADPAGKRGRRPHPDSAWVEDPGWSSRTRSGRSRGTLTPARRNQAQATEENCLKGARAYPAENGPDQLTGPPEPRLPRRTIPAGCGAWPEPGKRRSLPPGPQTRFLEKACTSKLHRREATARPVRAG